MYNRLVAQWYIQVIYRRGHQSQRITVFDKYWFYTTTHTTFMMAKMKLYSLFIYHFWNYYRRICCKINFKIDGRWYCTLRLENSFVCLFLGDNPQGLGFCMSESHSYKCGSYVLICHMRNMVTVFWETLQWKLSLFKCDHRVVLCSL